jgi:hypothetical protein
MGNPINPKLKLLVYRTEVKSRNMNFGFTPTPHPNPTGDPKIAATLTWQQSKWRNQDFTYYVPETLTHLDFVIAPNIGMAEEFIRRRNIREKIVPTFKPRRLRQGRVADTWYLSKLMRTRMKTNVYMNQDLARASEKTRETAFTFCNLVVSCGIVSREEMFAIHGPFHQLVLGHMFTHKLVEWVEHHEALVPGCTPNYAREFDAGNII